MQVEVVVPQIGEAVAELQIAAWLKSVGDEVVKGEVLFEVDSDKAIVEVEAFVDGKLIKIIHGDGSSVLPQDVVAIIETVDEQGVQPEVAPAPLFDMEPAKPVSELAKDGAHNHKVSPLAKRVATELGVNVQDVAGSGPGGRVMRADVYQHQTQAGQNPVNVSPKARRIARERNIDLRQITGTGVGGMVVVADLESVASAVVDHHAESIGSQTWQPLSKLRETIAIRTVESKQNVPHFYLSADVNMTQVNALRQYCTDKLGWERKPTYTDILVRVCGLAFENYRWANRSLVDNGIFEREKINIGVAVGTDAGLIVPVIPDANTLTLAQTVAAMRPMIERARTGKLKQSDFTEKSMVISNLGMFSIDRFIAIIDMPDPMILAVGQVADRVVPVNGEIVIQPMCTLTLSVDHRVFDGIQGAMFLERIKDRLENPFEILR